MLEALLLAGIGAGLYATYSKTRNFVRERLRFVDAAQRPGAAYAAGAVAAIAAAPVVALLPLVGAGTAIALGVSVAVGVKRGQRQVRQLTSG